MANKKISDFDALTASTLVIGTDLVLIEDTSDSGKYKKITVDELRKALIAAPVALSGSAIDWSLGNIFSKTLSANTTFTFANTASGQVINVAITNTSGNYTVAWPGTIVWAGGSAPTQTVGAKTDIYTFMRIGSTVYGAVSQDY